MRYGNANSTSTQIMFWRRNMEFNDSTEFDFSMVSQEFKEVEDEKTDTFIELSSSIGTQDKNNVDPLCSNLTVLSAEKYLFDGNIPEGESEWSAENSEIKEEHESERTLAYSAEDLENPESSFSLYISTGAKTENYVETLPGDGTALSTEKSLVGASEREARSECSEENIESTEQQESESVLSFSEEPFENLKYLQLKEHGRVNEIVEQLQCEICGYRSVLNNDMENHMGIHAEEMQLFSSICRYERNSDRKMKRQRTYSDNKRFQCEMCDYKSSVKSNLKQHVLTHTDERRFQCDMCGFKSTVKSNLKQHILTHINARPFHCQKCGYKCTQKSSLKKHMLTHTDERPFQCGICQLKFTVKSNLRQHILTHGDERPFQCERCGHKFTLNSHLKRHMLTHTDERPFKCELCGYKFTQKTNLKKHMLKHTDERSFRCDTCENKFTRKSHLKRHMLTHMNESPFQCETCEFKSTREGNLKRYMLTHWEDAVPM